MEKPEKDILNPKTSTLLEVFFLFYEKNGIIKVLRFQVRKRILGQYDCFNSENIYFSEKRSIFGRESIY